MEISKINLQFENDKFDIKTEIDTDFQKQSEDNENQFYDQDYIKSLRNKAKTNLLKNIDHEEWLKSIRGY